VAITSGTHTIGTSGDYATLNAFTSDISTQTGNLVGQFISDSTVSSNTFFSHDMANFNLTLEADNDHAGVITDAHNITIAHNNNGINPTGSMSNEGDFEVKGFRMTRSVGGSNTTKSLVVMFNFTGNMYTHHMFLDGGGVNGNGVGIVDRASNDRQLWSCLIWDCGYDGVYKSTGGVGGDFDVENVTVRNCTNGANLEPGNSEVVNNSAFFTNSNADINLTTAGTTTGDNNATTDATADDFNTQSNNNINLTESDQVESTTDTDADFMHPKATGVLTDGGKAPTISSNTTDITGTSYGGTYPIGCYLEQGGASGFGGLLSTQRNRLII